MRPPLPPFRQASSVAARRSFPLALPAGDPRSARIWELLDDLDADADRSAELRRLICEALDTGERLTRIEAHLAQMLAGGYAVATPPMDAAERAAVTGLTGQWEDDA
jgi:hypothetical protein